MKDQDALSSNAYYNFQIINYLKKGIFVYLKMPVFEKVKPFQVCTIIQNSVVWQKKVIYALRK